MNLRSGSKYIKRITIDAKLRIFQYKIIKGILPTNSLLHTYKIRENPWCERCPNIMDTLEHTLHLCPEILLLWYNMAQWLLPDVDLYQYINTENIILGIFNSRNDLENTLLLAIKRYIYVCKCKNELINDGNAKLFVKQIYISETNMQLEMRRIRNRNKWRPIENKLNNI